MKGINECARAVARRRSHVYSLPRPIEREKNSIRTLNEGLCIDLEGSADAMGVARIGGHETVLEAEGIGPEGGVDDAVSGRAGL
jgi:hypothetical protein